MLLNAIIIVLRESLEAGILISLLLSIGNRLALGTSWLLRAVLFGIMGSWVYAANLAVISNWFDYVGQEVINAGMQYAVFLFLLAVIGLISRKGHFSSRLLRLAMTASTTLAIIREGSEMIVYYGGFMHVERLLKANLTSGFIGLMLGFSIGALCYFGLMSLRGRYARGVQILMLLLVANGMLVQATQLLVQADWLPAAMPLWNTEWLLSESSFTGQLAYAVFGYESTPTPAEVASFVGGLLLAVTVVFVSRRSGDNNASPTVSSK